MKNNQNQVGIDRELKSLFNNFRFPLPVQLRRPECASTLPCARLCAMNRKRSHEDAERNQDNDAAEAAVSAVLRRSARISIMGMLGAGGAATAGAAAAGAAAASAVQEAFVELIRGDSKLPAHGKYKWKNCISPHELPACSPSTYEQALLNEGYVHPIEIDGFIRLSDDENNDAQDGEVNRPPLNIINENNAAQDGEVNPPPLDIIDLTLSDDCIDLTLSDNEND